MKALFRKHRGGVRKTLVIFAGLLFAFTAFTQTYTVEFLIGQNGALEGEVTQEIEHGQSASEVLAVPRYGYRFLRWSDGDRSNPRTVENVTRDMRLIAFLEQILIPVQYVTGVNGYIDGQWEQFIQIGGSTQPVTAIGYEGFVFSRWSDGRTNNPRTDVGVSMATFVAAEFIPTLSHDYELKAGWNLISFPFDPIDTEIDGLMQLHRWENGGYISSPDTLDPIAGHWAFTPRTLTVKLEGLPLNEDSSDSIKLNGDGKLCVTLNPGWNLVGVKAYVPIPPDVYPVWAHVGKGFVLETRILEPGRAYWIHVEGLTEFQIE